MILSRAGANSLYIQMLFTSQGCSGIYIYSDFQFNDTAMQLPINALQAKGFQVKHVKSEDECITELASNRYQIAWIISTSYIQNSGFISALTAFHSAGGAIFLFADNTPYVCHASEFLKTKFGISVEGNYPGDKTLKYKENGHQARGSFGQHEIFTGIKNLFEGVTICHPVYSISSSHSLPPLVLPSSSPPPPIIPPAAPRPLSVRRLYRSYV